MFNRREWLIDEKVERAVEELQKVIELGRLARDRRALPIKVCLFVLSLVHYYCKYYRLGSYSNGL